MFRGRGNRRTEACRRVEPVARVLSGSLTFCPACRSFGLSFGNLYLRLSPAELLRLDRCVTALARGHAPAMDGFRRFQLTLEPGRSAVLVYTDELLELRELLECGARYVAKEAAEGPEAASVVPHAAVH
ncbi:MAG: DUF6686 family protein [Thermoanaerobaculia bacterium]